MQTRDALKIVGNEFLLPAEGSFSSGAQSRVALGKAPI